jgi:hypothetical protein
MSDPADVDVIRRAEWHMKDNGRLVTYLEYECPLGRMLIPDKRRIYNWQSYQLLIKVIRANRRDPSPVYFFGLHQQSG